jgi:small subunit ribosomal protein S17e
LDRIRRLSELAMQRHPEAFGPDYEKNKLALRELTFIPSKQLRNHVAGYIARVKKEDKAEEEEPESEEAKE